MKPTKHRLLGAAAIAGVIVIALVGVLGFTSAKYWWPSNPRTATRDQLYGWLVMTDLSQRDEETRLALIDRCIEILDSGELGTTELSEDASRLTPAMRERLDANIDLLKREWFFSRVNQYLELSGDDRLPFLDRQSTLVFAYADAEEAAKADTRIEDQADRFFDDVQCWVNSVEGEQRERAEKAVEDSLICWLGFHPLEERPFEMRKNLASRIATRLNEGSQPGKLSESFNEEQKSQFRTNCQLLTEAWLHLKAEEFADLNEPQQQEFVGEQIDCVMRWGVLKFLSNSGDKPGLASLTEFSMLAEKWVARADDSIQPALRSFVDQTRNQLVQRAMSGAMQ